MLVQPLFSLELRNRSVVESVDHCYRPTMRLEYKYVVPHSLSDELFFRLRQYLSDATGDEWIEERYRVCSLYFDDPRLTYYWDKKNGQNDRQKIRIRQYNNDSILFCEQKWSNGERRAKVRNSLPLKSYGEFCRDWHEQWLSQSRNYPDFFIDAVREGARPLVWVGYSRRCVSHAAFGVRVSLDTNIQASSYTPFSRFDDQHAFAMYDDGCRPLTVLEIKVAKETYHLAGVQESLAKFRASNSKYCLAVEATVREP